jgi:NADPH:quinone reductase-like Zn-dependent oxidoreductase
VLEMIFRLVRAFALACQGIHEICPREPRPPAATQRVEARRQTSSALDGRRDVLDPHGQHLPGDLVAVLGIGRLGHLGVQFAVKIGFKTVAIARGTDKGLLARKLGAWRYPDSQAQNPAEELITLGGATVILATSTSGKAFAAVLGIDGKMIILLAVSRRIFPEPSPTVSESRERVPSEVQ